MSAAPQFQLYTSSAASNSNNMSPSQNPYYFNQPGATVNLTGKIGGPSTTSESTASTIGGSSTSGSSSSNVNSLINSLTSVVGQGYQQARSVIVGGGGALGLDDTMNGNSQATAFSLFSLGYQQMLNFAIFIGVGIIFMFLAFLFLPMIVFAPQKFVLLFTLGSVSWICGFASLQGSRNLLIAMTRPDRVGFSIAYVASLLGTFYACLAVHSYLLTLFFALVQIASLVVFLVSYFPGGPRVLNMVKDVAFDKVKNIFASVSGGSGSGSTILPV